MCLSAFISIKRNSRQSSRKNPSFTNSGSGSCSVRRSTSLRSFPIRFDFVNLVSRSRDASRDINWFPLERISRFADVTLSRRVVWNFYVSLVEIRVIANRESPTKPALFRLQRHGARKYICSSCLRERVLFRLAVVPIHQLKPRRRNQFSHQCHFKILQCKKAISYRTCRVISTRCLVKSRDNSRKRAPLAFWDYVVNPACQSGPQTLWTSPAILFFLANFISRAATHFENFSSENCNIFSVLSIFKYNPGEAISMISITRRRVQKESDELLYTVVFGHSLWSAISCQPEERWVNYIFCRIFPAIEV